MTAYQRFTRSPFTIALCTNCTADPDETVLAALKTTIRNCPHGMLMVTKCLLGTFSCATRGGPAGSVVMLQPCHVDRSPVGSAAFVGPIDAADDLAAVCAWIGHGEWNAGALPERLRALTHFCDRFTRLN